MTKQPHTSMQIRTQQTLYLELVFTNQRDHLVFESVGTFDLITAVLQTAFMMP
jgi:hypothetical protein